MLIQTKACHITKINQNLAKFHSLSETLRTTTRTSIRQNRTWGVQQNSSNLLIIFSHTIVAIRTISIITTVGSKQTYRLSE